MSNNNYTPFEQYPPKPLWDTAIWDRSHSINVSNRDTTWHSDRWLHTCSTVIGQWYLEKWLTTQEFLDAKQEIKELCLGVGVDHLCIHCSSRATVHDCKDCSNKGEAKHES